MSAIERILILDENESNILFFEMLLQALPGKNFKVYPATTGPQGEVLVREDKINMIICAWEMNAMPGTVFVQRIRQKNKRHIPCLIFSKRMTEQDIALTKDLGFENILGMPFDKKLAEETILKMVEAEDNVSPVEKKLRKIESLITEKKVTDALKMFDTSVTKKGPLRVRALASLAEIWVSTQNLEKADKTLDEALNEDPENTTCLRLKAKVHSLSGRHDKAIEMLEKMIEKSPKNITSLLSLGSAYVDADQPDKAKGVFKKVEALDSESQELKDEKAKLAFKEGDLPLAAQLLAETQNGDELARHFNNVAIARVAAGQYDDGILTYHNAIKLLVDKARLHQLYYNLGLAMKKKGDLQESFKKLCESYLSDPHFEKAYVALAKVSKEIKDSGNQVDASLVNKVKEARAKAKPKEQVA